MLGGACLCLSCALAAQLPPQAVVYLDTLAGFEGEPGTVRVMFYQVRNDSVGVIIRGLNGKEMAHVTEELRLGLYEGTGVYDVTGDGWPEVVMIGVGGARTLGATIYKYEHGRLHEIGRTSGYSVKVVSSRGQPVLVRQGQYGTLTELFVWKEGQFVESSDLFPEFHRPEIAQQKRILDAPKGLPVFVIAQACELGARALVYGKNYGEAEKLCFKALEIAASSPGLISREIGGAPETVAEERKQAEEQIRKTLKGIRKAQKKGLPRLPD